MNSPTSQPTDRELYDFCQREMNKALLAEDLDRMNLFWAESEKIKNRHGGMPPPTQEEPVMKNQTTQPMKGTQYEADDRTMLYPRGHKFERANHAPAAKAAADWENIHGTKTKKRFGFARACARVSKWFAAFGGEA